MERILISLGLGEFNVETPNNINVTNTSGDGLSVSNTGTVTLAAANTNSSIIVEEGGTATISCSGTITLESTTGAIELNAACDCQNSLLAWTVPQWYRNLYVTQILGTIIYNTSSDAFNFCENTWLGKRWTTFPPIVTNFLGDDGPSVPTLDTTVEELGASGIPTGNRLGTTIRIESLIGTTSPEPLWNSCNVFARETNDGGATGLHSEVFVADGFGVETRLSSHDVNDWVYYSKDTHGNVVRIKMMEAIKALEELTGEQFIFYE